jgi:hypothetical protein
MPLLTTALMLFGAVERSDAMTPAAEASSAAGYYWHKALVKCGADYYGYSAASTPSNPEIWDYRGVKFRTKLTPVTQWDRLNGVEWEAEAEMNVSFSRINLKPPNTGWSDWGPGDGENSTVTIQKRSGVISYSPAPDDAPPTCAAINQF